MFHFSQSVVRHARRALGLAASVVGVASGVAAVGVGAQVAPDAAAGYLYVCVQDEARIAVIDPGKLEVVRNVDLRALGFSANANPHHIAVEPDGSRWYVSLIGEGRVARFDRDGSLTGSFEMSTPGMLSYVPSRGVLLSSRSMSAVNPPTRVGWIDTESMEGDEIDVFVPRPHPMVVSPDGRWAYTGSLGVNQLVAIDLETDDAFLVDLEGPPHALVQFDISPDGRFLVAGTELSGRLLAFDLSDPAHPSPVADLPLGPMVFDPVFTPDGREVWVPVKGANEVAVVRVEDWSVSRRITGDSFLEPHQIVFSADGSRAFVSNNNKADHMAGPMDHSMHGDHAMPGADRGAGNGNVTVVDRASYEVVGVVELGRNVTGMGTAAP